MMVNTRTHDVQQTKQRWAEAVAGCPGVIICPLGLSSQRVKEKQQQQQQHSSAQSDTAELQLEG